MRARTANPAASWGLGFFRELTRRQGKGQVETQGRMPRSNEREKKSWPRKSAPKALSQGSGVEK